jgi:hypothetical protein
MGDKRILFGQEPLEENADGNLQFSGRKILDDGNALFSDIQDVNIPTAITAADDGKVVEAHYADPDAYGDGSDGDVVIDVNTVVDGFTDLIADAPAGATSINVRSNTEFSVGDEIMLIVSQAYRYGSVQSLGLNEFRVILDKPSATELLLDSGLSRTYLSDADGNKANNTKTQVVRVRNYESLTLNADLMPKSWDGYSGGVLAFRTKTVAGTGKAQAINRGYRPGSPSVEGEGYYGLQSRVTGGHGTVPNHSTVCGGHLNDGTNYIYTCCTSGPGLAYGLYEEQTATNPAMGGGSYHNGNASNACSGAGIVYAYVSSFTNYTGIFSAICISNPGSGNDCPGASGTVVVRTSAVTTLTADVSKQGGVSGSAGRKIQSAPDEPPTRQYQLGPKVSTAVNDLDTEFPTSKAVRTYASSNFIPLNAAIRTFYSDDDIVNGDECKYLIGDDPDPLLLTVPQGLSLTQTVIIQYGVGLLTIDIPSGVTVNKTAGPATASFKEQFGVATLLRVGTDEYLLFGAINPVIA